MHHHAGSPSAHSQRPARRPPDRATTGRLPTGAADVLSLAAAPTFALMALLMPILDRGPALLCAAGSDALPLDGMVVMYALMAGFHLPSWLRLIAGRRRPAAQRRVGSSET